MKYLTVLAVAMTLLVSPTTAQTSENVTTVAAGGEVTTVIAATSETSTVSSVTTPEVSTSAETTPATSSAATSESSTAATSESSSAATSEATTASTEAATSTSETPQQPAKPALSTPDLINAMKALVAPPRVNQVFSGGNFVDSPVDPQFAAADDDAVTAVVAPPPIEDDPEVAAANAAFLLAYEEALNRVPISDSPVVARAKALHLAVLEKANADDPSSATEESTSSSPDVAAVKSTVPQTLPAFSFFSGFPQSRGGFSYSTVSSHNPFPVFPNSGFQSFSVPGGYSFSTVYSPHPAAATSHFRYY